MEVKREVAQKIRRMPAFAQPCFSKNYNIGAMKRMTAESWLVFVSEPIGVEVQDDKVTLAPSSLLLRGNCS